VRGWPRLQRCGRTRAPEAHDWWGFLLCPAFMAKSRLTISATQPLWPLGDGCFFSVIFKLKVKILDLIGINGGNILYFQK